ncbi:PAS domain-containing protein [Telmatobacter sp. DSM 110680]|uniref:histidine kinase n=1 Tax=Telmatobacter sp. DSM 110680 TaxID=3036704 RepID=A0AAU7DE88_9BACT
MEITPDGSLDQQTSSRLGIQIPHLKQPRLEELLANAPAAIAFLSGPELRCSYVNDLAVRATGRISADQLLGSTFREGLPELEGTGIFEILDEAVRTREPFRGREVKIPFIQFETGETQDRYFDFVCQPMVDAAGILDGVFIHAVDLTDRVESRRALEVSQDRLRVAHEAAQMGTWEWDAVSNTPVLSSELHRLFGTDPNDDAKTITETWAARVHPADLPRVRGAIAESVESGAMEIEYRYLHPERGQRILHSKGRRVAGSAHLVGVVLDVTEAKTAVNQVKEQRERFAFAAEAAGIGYWFCDLPFDKLSWDDRVKEHFWLPADADVDIKLFYEIIHPDDRENTRRAIEESIRSHGRYDLEYRTVSAEGKQKWIRATGRTAYDAVTDVPIRFDGVTQDVTALKQTREALIRSEKLALVGRLAASISHEINNPLASVLNLLYLIHQNSNEETIREFSASAQQELARVSHIVTHTLRFNRQSNKSSREKLSDLLESSAAIYLARMKDAGIEVRLDYRDEQLVHCFGSELRQVFANLIGNSFDACKSGSKVLLRTRDQLHPKTGERGVRVTIADNGTGMDKRTLHRLFEPFFTTKGDKGTGLGLWVSREILRKHHAVLRVRSGRSAEGSGTTFSIWLPAESNLVQEG